MCRKFLFIITGLFIIIFAEAQRAEDFVTVADDGAWCWFSDPRSIYYKGIHERIYTGFVTSQGDIMVSSEDLHSGDKEVTILYSKKNSGYFASNSPTLHISYCTILYLI